MLNTHFKTQEIRFYKLKEDGSTRLIKPGRVYLAESGDKFTYDGIDIEFELQKLTGDGRNLKQKEAKKEEIKEKIPSLKSIIKPKVENKEPKIKQDMSEENIDPSIFDAPTQVNPGILKKKVKAKIPREEIKEETKDLLDDIIDQPTLIMPRKGLEKPVAKPKKIEHKAKKVGFIDSESESEKTDKIEESKEGTILS